MEPGYFVCIHCNRLVERKTYDQHHCVRRGALQASLKRPPRFPLLKEGTVE